MNKQKNAVLAGAVLVAAMLAGCGGGGSGVGEQPSPPPVAWAKALNHPFTGANGDITLTARAGSEVFLSAKDSFGPTLPVIRYKWTQTRNDTGKTVAILTRNPSTMSITVPQTLTSGQQLQYRLEVFDSDGRTDQATVTINIDPTPDPDAFLQYDGERFYTVAAVTNTPAQLADGADEAPFTIRVERRITYFDLAGQKHTDFVLDSQTLEGKWLGQYGTGGTDDQCGSVVNPRFLLPLPTLDADDILAKLSPEPADQQRALDPSRIDEAEVTLRFTITVGGGLPAGVDAGVCVLGADDSFVATAQKPALARQARAASSPVLAERIVELDDIAGPANDSRDTRASAEAYYAAIDPENRKTTLVEWLRETRFATDKTDWDSVAAGSTAHAVYLNNFDLGFGRDMYMRLDNCDGGTPPDISGTVSPAVIGTCDVYGIVMNYASLEAAAKKTGPLLAVAMEYARLPGSADGSPRVTTFYVFAPDATGTFKRVLSANLDGRGERYVPQACTVCHGGTPRGIDTTPGVDLHGDGKPDYGNAGDVEAGFMTWDLDSFLYSNTDPAFSKATDPYFPADEQQLVQDLTRTRQEASLRTLNKLAYMTFANPSPGRFDYARELVESWYGGPGLPGTTFDGSKVPDDWDDTAESTQLYREVFAQNCRACHVLQVPGASNQVAMGSYDDFITAANLADTLGAGRMPFARLTMDRLWTTGASAVLQEHLVDAGKGFARPGTLDYCIEPTAIDVDRNALVTFSGTCSRFASTYPWSVMDPDGIAVPVVGDGTPMPAFRASKEGVYRVSLGAEGTDVEEATATVAKAVPIAGSTTTPLARQLPQSGTLVFDVDVFADLGSSSRDPIRTLRVTGASGVTSAVPSVAAPGSRITITVSALAPALSRVTYSLEDTDGDVSATDGVIELDIGAALTVGNTTLSVDANGQKAFDLSTLVSGAPAGQALGYEITTAPALAGSRGAGSATLNGSNLTYTVRRGVAPRFPGTGIVLPPGELDVVVFRVYFQSRPTSGASGTVRADLLAQQAFAAVASDMRANCSGCHGAQQEGSALVLKSNDSEETIYCALTAGSSVTGGSGTESSGTDYVSLASPAASLVYEKVRGGRGHGGGNVVANAGFDDAALLKWIDEGGYYTSAASKPTCTAAPPPNTGAPAAGSLSLASAPIQWLNSAQRSRDIDVSAIPGTENAVVISLADLVASPEVTVVRKNSLTLTVTLNSLAGAPSSVGTVRYKVKNLTGQLSGEGVIDVYGTADPPSLKTTSFTSTDLAPNSAATPVLTNLTAADKLNPTPSGLGLDCRLTTSPVLQRNPAAGAGANASATVSCAAVSYVSPRRTQTKFGSTRFNPADRVGFKVCYTGSNICSTEATVAVDIAGSADFGALHGTLETNCFSSCHDGSGNAASTRWVHSASQKATWCSIRAGKARDGSNIVNVAVPGSSPFYYVPVNSQLTDGQSHSTRTDQADAVLAWLNEGAYYTPAADQTCP